MSKPKLPDLFDPGGSDEARLSARESWRMFEIMAEFVEATERLAPIAQPSNSPAPPPMRTPATSR